MKFKQNILPSLGLTISGLALFASAANATFTEPRLSDEDIIVTGNKTTKAGIADFINTTIAEPKGGKHDGQYARLSNAICPKVVGLSYNNKLQVEQRMRGVAKAADMRVAAESCVPNVYVIVVSDGTEAVNMLRKKRSRLFGGLSHYERRQVANLGGPTYSWKRKQIRSADTGALQNSDEADTVPGSLAVVPIMYTTIKSNIQWTTEHSVTHSFLLIEKDALVGLTTIQIADYAAMRSFIDTEKRNSSSPPRFSILSLFDPLKAGEEAPTSVSEMDLVLLSSLYNSPSDRSAAMQSATMLHRIEKELTSQDGE